MHKNVIIAEAYKRQPPTAKYMRVSGQIGQALQHKLISRMVLVQLSVAEVALMLL